MRLPKLLENGDVLVYILGQVGAHSLRVVEEAIELLLRDAKDLEYNLIGVCALGRVLKSPILAASLRPRLGYYAERLRTVIERCEQSVGGRVLGYAGRAMSVAQPTSDDSVQLVLTKITNKKDRAVATRLAADHLPDRRRRRWAALPLPRVRPAHAV